jgi:cyclophilin family peptidyl-prolyl cis-trans isomerase
MPRTAGFLSIFLAAIFLSGSYPQKGPIEVAVVETNFGNIVIRFYEPDAPRHAANFKKLARQGFYTGLRFHRTRLNFMIQGGDPNSRDDDPNNDGQGGPGYTIPAEIKRPNLRGTVAAARLGDQVNPAMESSGSQFYINLKHNDFLDGKYTVFGEVIEGMDVVDKIVAIPADRLERPSKPVFMQAVYLETRNGKPDAGKTGK